MPATDAFGHAQVRTKAYLGSAVVMVAAERFRRAQGRWPETSAAEIEEVLKVKLPRDAYRDGPYLLKATDSGLVVYSVGPDQKDNGGALNNRKPELPDVDVGYRLWDVARRRRP